MNLEILKKRILVINLENLDDVDLDKFEPILNEYADGVYCTENAYISSLKFKGSERGQLFHTDIDLIRNYLLARNKDGIKNIIPDLIRGEFDLYGIEHKKQMINNLRKLADEFESDLMNHL